MVKLSRPPVSLTAKKAFVLKNRRRNYRASMVLEGFDFPDASTAAEPLSNKAAVIARYSAASR